jgi:SAM-dependent methyltransferase
MLGAGMSVQEQLQREYYERTAGQYDAAHVVDGDEHYIALKYISMMIGAHGLGSALDVGCGTGRGMKYLAQRHPEMRIHGIEPVDGLIRQAIETNGISQADITKGSGESLPFENENFDAVYECGVLHHAKEPEQVVREMMRVGRKAIFLSDENRFAYGSALGRWGKLLLWKSGLFNAAYRLKTRGKGYRFSEGDGLAYSYSVFDCAELLGQWADRVILVPLDATKPKTIFAPMMSCFHVLLCAVRD